MKTLMIQGTSSSTGKSAITTGLCRLFRDRGVRVCPFKAQNISLNTVVSDGYEASVSQYIQAQACGVPYDPMFNPLLIQIYNDRTRFYVNGSLVHDGDFGYYYRRLPEIKEYIKEAYLKLSENYDLVIIEGAGSPAEINRTTDDLPNMWMANVADAVVILVSNIELGGAFASIAGTMELLETQHRKYVKGFVFNKFSGDSSILDKGIKILENRYNTKCLGTVPYIGNLNLGDEDTLYCNQGRVVECCPEQTEQSIDALASLITQSVDIDELIRLIG